MFPSLQRISRRISLPIHRKSSTALALLPPPAPPPAEAPAPKSKAPDLATYLSTTPESRTDTTYVGTKYEYTVQASLQRLGFLLAHHGGANDYGIDLLGTWRLPDATTSLKVLVSCKTHQARSNPSWVRELEGTFAGAPREWRVPCGVMALLASSKSASPGVRNALGRSPRPMGFVCVDREGNVLQMLWNRAAEEEGLAGVGVGLRYPGHEETSKAVLMIWKGKPVEGDEVEEE